MSDKALVPEVIQPGALYKPKAASEVQLDKLRQIEDRLYEKASVTINNALRADEIDGGEVGPPMEWVQQLGAEEAMKAWRTAVDIRKPPASRPGHIDLARSLLVGISRSRETRAQTSAPPLQVQVIVAVSPQIYPELEVEAIE